MQLVETCLEKDFWSLVCVEPSPSLYPADCQTLNIAAASFVKKY